MITEVLGGGPIDGQLGDNPDWGSISCPSGRTLQSTLPNGSTQFWYVSATQEVGGHLLASENYANPRNVSGNSLDNSNMIQAMLVAHGYSGAYGYFNQGFTVDDKQDLGVDNNYKFWRYVGSVALPYEVPNMTDPNSGDWERITFSIRAFDSTVAMRSHNYYGLPQDTRIDWLGYRTPSDGGSNWGLLKFGDSTSLVDDGGSIFIIVNDAINGVWIEANLKTRVSVLKFGAKRNDATYDNTPNLLAVHAFANHVYYPAGVYDYDPSPLDRGIPCKEGQKIEHAPHAVVRLKEKHYVDNTYYLGTSYAILFPDDSNRYKGLDLVNINYDGNSENVTLANNKSSNVLFLYKQDNPKIKNFESKNMPVGNGGLPAIILKFCENFKITNPVTKKEGAALYATDRQSISVIESTGSIRGGSLSNSRVREPLLVSSETPVAWKKSEVDVHGGVYDNRGTESGSRIVRFSGAADGSLSGGLKLISDKTNQIAAEMDAIFVAYPVADGMPIAQREHDIVLGDVQVVGAKTDVRIQNDGLTKVTVNGLRSYAVDNALTSTSSYSNGVATGFLKILAYYSECASRSFSIINCEDVQILQAKTVGGSEHAEISAYGRLTCESVSIDSNTDPNYVLNVENQLADYAVTFNDQPVISNCGGFGNTNNVMRFAGVSTASGNAIAWLGANNTFNSFAAGGAGSIPCTRNGFYWLWHDGSGVLRTKGGAPKAVGEGVSVGSQA